jgi:hypothetical protein
MQEARGPMGNAMFMVIELGAAGPRWMGRIKRVVSALIAYAKNRLF